MRVRLKMVLFDVDFRKNAVTNMDEFRRSKNFPGELKKGEVFLFVSKGRDQLRWIMKGADIEAWTGPKRVHPSWLWKIEGGSWHPWMLADYAEKFDLELIGIKKFDEHYEKYRQKRAGKKTKKSGKITRRAA